ncbi:hypothetical protein L1887_53516 [Cichorium endivia]|nr:hypothetical protein L1887_53516 [Cichorium endivia]
MNLVLASLSESMETALDEVVTCLAWVVSLEEGRVARATFATGGRPADSFQIRSADCTDQLMRWAVDSSGDQQRWSLRWLRARQKHRAGIVAACRPDVHVRAEWLS